MRELSYLGDTWEAWGANYRRKTSLNSNRKDLVGSAVVQQCTELKCKVNLKMRGLFGRFSQVVLFPFYSHNTMTYLFLEIRRRNEGSFGWDLHAGGLTPWSEGIVRWVDA